MLSSLDFYIYKAIKEIAKYLRNHMHTFVIFLCELVNHLLGSEMNL
ncbi:DUF787 family protein (plasmid) [Borrelia sp. A-FGy1]|nr:DUF787 family protein [Borrelia sp. A-FGy1]